VCVREVEYFGRMGRKFDIFGGERKDRYFGGGGQEIILRCKRKYDILGM